MKKDKITVFLIMFVVVVIIYVCAFSCASTGKITNSAVNVLENEPGVDTIKIDCHKLLIARSEKLNWFYLSATFGLNIKVEAAQISFLNMLEDEELGNSFALEAIEFAKNYGIILTYIHRGNILDFEQNLGDGLKRVSRYYIIPQKGIPIIEVQYLKNGVLVPLINNHPKNETLSKLSSLAEVEEWNDLTIKLIKHGIKIPDILIGRLTFNWQDKSRYDTFITTLKKEGLLFDEKAMWSDIYQTDKGLTIYGLHRDYIIYKSSIAGYVGQWEPGYLTNPLWGE